MPSLRKKTVPAAAEGWKDMNPPLTLWQSAYAEGGWWNVTVCMVGCDDGFLSSWQVIGMEGEVAGKVQ